MGCMPVTFTCTNRDWAGVSSIEYIEPATLHFLNSITFRVSVPVLSENTYFTMPSSSFRLEVRAIAGVSDSAWYISMSMLMKIACARRLGRRSKQEGISNQVTSVRWAKPIDRVSTPLNSYRCRFGGSLSSVPRNWLKSFVSRIRLVVGTPCRIFRFVSPSRLDVSMKDMPCGSLEDSSTRSAGKKVLLSTLTMSPTDSSCHLIVCHWPFCSTSIRRWLISSSARCRLMSSTISLIALTASINISGTSVVYRPVGDTSGICCSSAINRKKQFEYRRNCSNRNEDSANGRYSSWQLEFLECSFIQRKQDR
uniref:Uncharacterized protein n=1 Tax=Anopheles melas TaxID=34690 RepID=A0A182TRG4_9DIPT